MTFRKAATLPLTEPGKDIHTYIRSHTRAPKFTQPCHSTEGKGHGLTKGTQGDQGRREEKARKSSFLTCIWPPDGL